MKKKIIYGLIGIAIVIQFFRIDKKNPAVNSADDLIEIVQPPQEIAACYDCHSFESKYPWYSNVAPVSWWVKYHIDEGREELNFSKWSTYSAKKKDHKLEEIVEEVEEGEMPLKPYPITHPDAQLSEMQKEEFITWVKGYRKAAKEKKSKNTLHLNDGEKWEADQATNTAIDKMIEITNFPVKGDVKSYKSVGIKLSKEMKALFGVCTMKGEAHDQLHIFLVPLVAKFRNLENVKTEEEAVVMQEDIFEHLQKYNTYFI